MQVFATPASSATIDQLPADLYTFFFTTGGTLADDFVSAGTDGSFSTTLDASGLSSGRTGTVWLVLRDARGGVDWVTRTFFVE